jgi:hypothetical protein
VQRVRQTVADLRLAAAGEAAVEDVGLDPDVAGQLAGAEDSGRALVADSDPPVAGDLVEDAGRQRQVLVEKMERPMPTTSRVPSQGC